jgi:hypothetical protein
VTALRRFDRIDVADDVRDGYVGSGEFFDKARVAIDPLDTSCLAFCRECLPSVSRDWPERIVVNLGSGEDRDSIVEQIG